MNPLEGVRLALSQIWTYKLKSFFALLGIMVGITFLITVITVVEGVDRYVQDDLGGAIAGVNTFNVVQRTRVVTGPQSDALQRQQARNPRLTAEDVEVVRGAVPDALHFAWSAGRRLPEARHGEHRRRNVRALGGSEQYEALQGWSVQEGRGLVPLDHRRALRVAVIGSEVAERLFPESSPLGEPIRMAGQRFQVVGVFEPQGGLLGNIRDATVLVPWTAYVQTLASYRDEVHDIQVKVRRADELDGAMLAAEGALRADRGLRPGQENNFHIETTAGLLGAWDTINRILMTALPGIVSVALVVGGIVIMNIMLVAVTQRTREIGLRKALGARQRDVMLQFLAEASTLSVLGAVVGVLAGMGLAAGIEALTPLPAATPAWAVAVSVVLGVAVGLASGVYPARRAARLDPIEALRQE